MVWPISGVRPDHLPELTRLDPRRRGPVPDGPILSAAEQRHVFDHLRHIAERAPRTNPRGLLATRQAYYLLGFDPDPGTAAWLREQYRQDQRRVPPRRGWSPAWPLARSTACALARLGDPDPMLAFVADQLADEAGEVANLNYWAFWAGEYYAEQTADTFMSTTPLTAWPGDRLIRHLCGRLDTDLGFIELNVHSLWALIQVQPELSRLPGLADDLNRHIERLLDENLVSTRAKRELGALRYGIAIAIRP
jgi:hypothetical protein